MFDLLMRVYFSIKQIIIHINRGIINIEIYS
jgi:hypothetical protein